VHVADDNSAVTSGLKKTPAFVLPEDSSFLLNREKETRCKEVERRKGRERVTPATGASLEALVVLYTLSFAYLIELYLVSAI
jgi:hypothetical protein